MSTIASLVAREILDSRGHPTIEVDVILSDGAQGRASVPSGGSRGHQEASELRDGDERRYSGLGLLSAIAGVNDVIAPAMRRVEATDQAAVDTALLNLDGTNTKRKLGGNTILGVSMACARAAATGARVPLYRHMGGPGACLMPVPMFDVLNGGAHADNNLDFEEFMIAPVGAPTFAEALRWGTECYHALRSTLARNGYRTSLGDEGGYAPDLRSNEEALELILSAIDEAGFSAGSQIVLAIDAATNGLYDGDTYSFTRSDGSRLSSADLVAMWVRWVREYPIWCIEDGMAEDDYEGWRRLTRELGRTATLVGDDVFSSDPDVISEAIGNDIGNAALVKLDQIGTVTEAIEAIEEARAGRYKTIVSCRSGETNDDFIADFAVATGVGAIKSGAPARGERVAKYNRLLRIEEQLGADAHFAGPKGLKR